MRIKLANKILRTMMNKTDDGSQGGGGGLPPKDDWNIDSMGFIDDPQLLALMDDDNSQPDVNDDDGLDESEADANEDGLEEKESEESEEDEAEAEEAEAEESEEDEDETEAEEEDETEAEEAEEAEEEDEPESKGKQGSKGEKGTDDRGEASYVAEIKRQRNRAQEAEKKLRDLRDAVANGGAAKTKELKDVSQELEDLQDKYEDALLDGDKALAKDLRAQVREKQDKYNSLSVSTTINSERGLADAKAELVSAQNEALAIVFKRYPQLDINSDKGNAVMINIINGMIKSKVEGGANVVAAIAEAVDEGVMLLRLDPEGETAKADAGKRAAKQKDKKQKEAVERRIDAVSKSKRSGSRRSAPNGRLDANKVGRWSEADMDSAEGKQALEKRLGIRFSS